MSMSDCDRAAVGRIGMGLGGAVDLAHLLVLVRADGESPFNPRYWRSGELNSPKAVTGSPVSMSDCDRAAVGQIGTGVGGAGDCVH